ncbi:MAG: EF-hand domain-containing protein [Armatimonadota bacterium]
MKTRNLLVPALALVLLTGSALCAGAQKPGPGPQGQKPQSPFEMMDANKDGAVTLDEFSAKPLARFAELDANKDGKVTKAEIDKAVADLREKMKQRMEEMFTKLDKNADGVIGKDEVPPKAQDKFQKMDTNNDGQVTKAEFVTAHQAMQPGQDLAHYLVRFDANKDGAVTLDEVKAQVSTHFTKIDKDGDGKITKAEWEAFHAQHKPGHQQKPGVQQKPQ